MTVAATNRTRMSYAFESEYATVPTPAPTLQDIRFTAEGLKQTTGTASSEEIRADRNVPDMARLSIASEGDVNVEMSYGTHDEWLEAALMGTWTAESSIVASDTVAVVAATQTYESVGAFGGFIAGQWFIAEGFAEAANNGFKRVVSATADAIVVSSDTPLVDEGAGETISLRGGEGLANGVVLRTMLIEKHFTDLEDTYALFRGLAINQMTLNVQNGALITSVFSFMGHSEESTTASVGAGYSPATTSGIMNSVDDVNDVRFDGAEYCALQLNITVANNLRGRECIGKLGPQSIGYGQCIVTGTFQAYFKDHSTYAKYLNFLQARLSMTMRDEDGNCYIFDLGRVHFSDGQRVAGGNNQDFILELPWTAILSDEGHSIKITRISA